MGDILDSLELLSENDRAKFCTVFYDFNNKRELSSKLFYSKAEDIAHTLKELSLTRLVIACLLKPSLALPVIVLGILKVSSYFAFGDAYRPLISLINFQKYLSVTVLLLEKPSFERIKKHLCSCWNIKKELVFEDSPSIVLLQSENCSNSACRNSKPQIYPNSQLCYAIQTSGTTGEPKIVQVPKQCILPNIIDLRSRFNMTESDVVLLCSPLSFDPSIVDMFLALSSGCKLVVVPDQLKTTAHLKHVIIDSKVTIIQCTPSLLQCLGDKFIEQHLLSSSSPLRVLALGGEQCPCLDKLKQWKAPENSTRIFNIYGLTEISCWASCFEVDLDKQISQTIPIGKPLQDTVMEIRNEEVFVGGPKRWCVINDEQWPIESIKNPISIVRQTGDIVYQDEKGHIYFESRRCNVIKHNGRKLSIEKINSLLKKFDGISNHYIHFDSIESKLLLFVVMNEDLHLSIEDIRDPILKSMRMELSLPKTELIPVSHIPLTTNGKANYRKLLQVANKRLNGKSLELLSEDSIEETVSKLWKNYTNELAISDADNFILRGGDSISAIQLMSDVEWELQLQLPVLVEILLNKSYKDVLHHIISQVNCKKKKALAFNTFKPIEVNFNNGLDSTPLFEPSPSLRISPPSPKKFQSDVVPMKTPISSSKRFRPNNYPELPSFQCYELSSRRHHLAYCTHPNESCFSLRENTSYEKRKKISLQMFSKFDLKKCNDASPTAAYFFQSGLMLVFIGSHSGIFACCDILKQDFKWTATLSDRIESSACLSQCGNFVLVGCYDYHLYCFDSLTGTISWKFKTDAEVKSSPVVSSHNIVYVGSHDKHLYAIELQGGALLWKKRLGQGSVFSSPALYKQLNTVAVATLDGVFSALDMFTGPLFGLIIMENPSSPLHGFLIVSYLLGQLTTNY